MTYETESRRLGRKTIVVIEMDLDFCQNVYGEAPCTAEVGVTGVQKCFNTFATCQDPNNYTQGTKTYRFTSENAELPIGQTVLPCVRNASTTPTEIQPEGFSIRATLNVQFSDFAHHDRGIDPYVDERTYNPLEQGSFWSKFIARNEFINGREVRVKTGYLTSRFSEDWDTNFKTRTYFIDSLSNPDSNGRVKLVAKDVLKFASRGKRQYPLPSEGVLDDVIDASQTTLTLAPSGIIDDYPATGVIRINDEIMTYSGKSGDDLTGLVRAYGGTLASSHEADDRVQVCVEYQEETIPDILEDLLVTGAGISSSFIPKAEWDAEADLRLSGFTFTRILSEPEDISGIIDSLIESAQVNVWFDEIEQKIMFAAVSSVLPSDVIPTYNDNDNLIQGSVSIKKREDLRLSRVIVSYGLINQAEDVEVRNTRSTFSRVQSDLETENTNRTPQIKNIVSPWINSEVGAISLADRLLLRYRRTPSEFTFMLDAKNSSTWTGFVVDLNTRLFTNPDGSNRNQRLVVTSVTEQEYATMFQYKALSYIQGEFNTALFAPNDTVTYTNATDEVKQKYGFFSDDDGNMSDGSKGYGFA